MRNGREDVTTLQKKNLSRKQCSGPHQETFAMLFELRNEELGPPLRQPDKFQLMDQTPKWTWFALMHPGRCHIVLSFTSILVCIADPPTCRFTRQALLRGRLDLTQVDGLIETDTEVLKFRTFREYELWAAQRSIVFSKLNVMCRDRPAKTMTPYFSNSSLFSPPSWSSHDFGQGEDIEERAYEQGSLLSRLLSFLPARSLLPSRIQKHLTDNRRGEIVHP